MNRSIRLALSAEFDRLSLASNIKISFSMESMRWLYSCSSMRKKRLTQLERTFSCLAIQYSIKIVFIYCPVWLLRWPNKELFQHNKNIQKYTHTATNQSARSFQYILIQNKSPVSFRVETRWSWPSLGLSFFRINRTRKCFFTSFLLKNVFFQIQFLMLQKNINFRDFIIFRFRK